MRTDSIAAFRNLMEYISNHDVTDGHYYDEDGHHEKWMTPAFQAVIEEAWTALEEESR